MLPPRTASIGRCEVRWTPVSEGILISARGGTVSERQVARQWMQQRFASIGMRVGNWDDIMAKAKRLIQSGNVQVLRNGYQNVVGMVQGDHGTYQPEIFRQDPNSRAITGSSCECDWGGFQNQPRTRIWKKYQDRPCAHILALYWQALGTPLDEDAHPAAPAPGGAPGPGAPGMAPGPSPAPGGAPMPVPAVGPGGPQGAPGEPTGPTPQDVLPQFQQPEPPVNPASVPGLKGPSPLDPIQYPAGPGSTFSSWQFSDKMMHMADVDTTTSLNNGDVVQLRYDDTGTLVGRSEEHGAGQPADIKAGQQGEVLGTDPTTGMVNVLWMGHPWDQNTIMEPYGATGWHFRHYLVPRPDVRQPGVNVRRPRGVH